MGKLTVGFIQGVKEPGRYGDGDTLFLNVSKGGARSWVQRVVIDGRRCDLGLGPYPVVPLAKARRRAFENRVKIDDGIDPLAEKRRPRVPTFRAAAEKTFAANRTRWRHASTAAHWTAGMRKHAYPVLGDMSVDRIEPQDVLRILTPVWTDKPEIARKLRQRIRLVLKWCESHGYVSRNVAGDGLDGALPTMPRVREHFRALPYADVQSALQTVEASPASLTTKQCLRFIVLTAVRSGEARGATWAEIDVGARTWTIPASRMKAKVGHRVPLSAAALAVLGQAREIDDGSGLVFASPRKPGRTLSDGTLSKILRENGLACVVHGFRSSFRDWCAETGKPRETAEAALAHAVAGVEGAYFRSDLFERRRHLMDSWGAFVSRSGSAKVVNLR